ncbi:pyridoxal phosphate-dependent decarboxylase family protein [Erwinia oleae]|uniref:pyridoxal phosphate-dependent decarboxylase family protein n=1 Tax=Erwinia oleae TaxID=796334 RepID=UPI000AB5B12B|nr:pyridoxal-dependent decarboxylase [Erwinia oleae]
MAVNEFELLADAEVRASAYLKAVNTRCVYPDEKAIEALSQFEEALPQTGHGPTECLALLDDAGSPATVASNGPRYFGYVVGASLPVAAAADRLIATWDQSGDTPAAAVIEKIAARWVLDILDLPGGSAVGFGTSATACGLSCIAAARRALLKRQGWDLDENGLVGAPRLKVVVSERIHVVVLKALRVLGFGKKDILTAPTNDYGAVDPARLPPLDDKTILCLQAGEVNTGEFDPFNEILPVAAAAGAWVHIDGAFGLWARATSKHKHLTAGIELADSWTTDGHKWLNTPYDCAMAICRDADALAETMNSDAVYATASKDAQRNLTLEFSRKARGILIWAALRSLGRSGVASLIEGHISQAAKAAAALKKAGFTVLNRVVLNQVLIACEDDNVTRQVQAAVERSGEAWFGLTRWNDRIAFRLSICSWRTTDKDISRLTDVIIKARDDARS